MAKRRKQRGRPNNTSRASLRPRSPDVLLGRGSGTNQFIGNKRFRDLADERKKDYVEAVKYRDKGRIAQELLDHVHSLGGRFLQLSEEPEGSNIVNDGKWELASEDVALEKCKQVLREKRHHGSEKPEKGPTKKDQNHQKDEWQQQQDTVEEAGAEPLTSAIMPSLSLDIAADEEEADTGASSLLDSSAHGEIPLSESSFSFFLPSTLAGHYSGAVDSPLQLYQQQSPAHHFQARTMSYPEQAHSYSSSQHPNAAIPYISVGPAHRQQPQCATDNVLSSNVERGVMQPLPVETNAVSGALPLEEADDLNPLEKNLAYDSMGSEDLTPLPKDTPSQENEGEYLLSLLSLSNRPTISEEQEQRERATLADEERAAVLADVFGERCTIDARPEKRSKRDLDRDSIAFLVGQMRWELARIPHNEKQALIEAQSRSHPEEFSDARLLTFLRCEGMNVKLAAQRFVKYWDCRREVFGPSKYVMRQRLSEALREDLVALEAGLICRLPFRDSSGREMIYVEPCRHTRKGYTSESMQRALWYMIETVALDSTAIDGGIVQVLWDTHSTMFDYDPKVNDRINYYRDHAWPVRVAAIHICCSPKFVVRILKPILSALKTKTTRSRTLFHNVPPNDILRVLAHYGILPDMLPKEMGGTVVLNQREWLENRWAIEMEEI